MSSPHIPKKTKYRKCHKMPLKKGYCYKACQVRLGDFGLQAVTSGIITDKQIEAARRAINRQIKQSGKTHIRVLADKPVTRKPNEVKLGKGKGNVDHWCLPVKAGRIIYEITSNNESLSIMALKKGGAKLPFKTKVITRAE